MTFSFAPARAAASRRNGAKSAGPKTAPGKARSARNALKHGLCAQTHVVLADEDAQAFAALEASIIEELAPAGALQRILAARIVRAAWRLERAERIEAELFEFRMDGEENLALALIRDGNGTRSFDTLMRYRGSALAEFFRALRTLQVLQDEARTIAVEASGHAVPQQRNKPETRANPGPAPAPDRQGSARVPSRNLAGSDARPARATEIPKEPKGRGNPGKTARTPAQTNPRHRLEFMD